MISFPYTSVKSLSGNTLKFDRAIDSKIKRLYNKLRYTEGIAPDAGNGFQVVSDSGMNVRVNCAGAWCHVGGDFGYEPAAYRVLAVQAPDLTYDRIDMVVLRNDITQSKRAIDLYVVKGVPSSRPIAPALTKTPEVQEICIATLFVARGVNTISQDRITDTRLNSSLCGMFTNAFGKVDTTQFFNQLDALAKKIEEEIKRIEMGSAAMLKGVYDANDNGVVDDAEKLNGQPGSYYASAASVNRLFSARLLGNGWSSVGGGTWTQRATCTGMSASYDVIGLSVKPEGERVADQQKRDVLNLIVSAGYVETGNGEITVTVYEQPPQYTVDIYMVKANGAAQFDALPSAEGVLF